jgi:spore coat polysaccharide biosynthesis protein SpsF
LPPEARIVVQARMQSSRLPGKVLANLGGRPLLEFVVRRLQAACQGDGHVLVATSTLAADDAIDDCCRGLGVACIRGSQTDVLGRYVAATADMADTGIVVRATADNPCYCPRRTAAIVAEHRRREADYTCIEGLSYVVPEVMQVAALRSMAARAGDARCREHVTPYFREAAHAFRVEQLPINWHGLRPDVRLTVDTPEELQRMAAICRTLAQNDVLFTLEDAYLLYDSIWTV